MQDEHTTSSFRADLAALRCFAKELAAQLQPGDVLLLYGSLGAGKTTLTQLLASFLGVGENEYVSSPSFSLVHEYQGRLPIYHMDLYRLGGEDDVEASGLLEYFDDQGVVVVEWPERLGDCTPADYLGIHLHREDAGQARLMLFAQGRAWQQRVLALQQSLHPFRIDTDGSSDGSSACS